MSVHHFILTRFNLSLWHYDKNGATIDRDVWLEERLQLFEQYCLPSIIGQNNHEFTWILLVDANTPEKYVWRIKSYKELCPQIHFVSVKSNFGFKFAYVFKEVVAKLLKDRGANVGDICLTTYFDNDDCLHKSYIEDIQKIALTFDKDTFVSYDYGIQYFTELQIATRIKYPNNHFITLCEIISSAENIRTCYGYGSHFTLEAEGKVNVRHIIEKGSPMWIEVIHKNNVDNDVKMTFDTKILNSNSIKDEFSIDVPVSKINLFRYFVRCMQQIIRRSKDKFIPRKW